VNVRKRSHSEEVQPWREERKEVRVGKRRAEAESMEGCGGGRLCTVLIAIIEIAE